MTAIKHWLLPIFVLFFLTGCSESLLEAQNDADRSQAPVAPSESKLRHPQLAGQSASSVASKFGDDSEVFVAFNEYEADGLTRRVLDAYGITKRVLEEYGVTRRVLQGYGITKRVLESYGVSRRVLESYGITRRVLEGYGITAEALEKYEYTISEELLTQFGLSFEKLEAQGVSRRVLDEYSITRRVLSKYAISDEQWDAAVAAFERSLRLKVRIDGARPGVFLSLGSLPLLTFLEEVGDDIDISFVEIDVTLSGPPVGTISRTDAGNELIPWGVNHIGAPSVAPAGLDKVHVYVLDSGVRASSDLNVVERKDFTMLFTNRQQTTWDDTKILEMPYFDPGSDGNPEDETGHGTHIAGSIGAMANGRGVVGTAPGVAIHSLKVLTGQGQTDITTVLSALDYVIVQKLQNPATPIVVNLSLGMDIETTAYNVLDEGVRRATDHGIHVVVSAGNAASDARTFSPAHVSEALTVGSYGPMGTFSTFSNHGAGVDLLAPGDLIASLSNDPADEAANLAVIESGTSMAAGHATGAVALLLASNPQAQPSYARKFLMPTALATVGSAPAGTANRALSVGHSSFQFASLPPFLQFAVAARGSVKMKPGTSITAPAVPGVNASVYTGNNLEASGDVQGFGYHVNADYSRGSFAPAFNPSGLEPIRQIEALDMPGFDSSDLLARARKSGVEIRETAGDLVLSESVQLGTAEAPVVWHVTGTLTNTRQTTISGFGAFVVDGEVRLNQSVSTANASQVAIFGGSYIWVARGTSITAHLMAGATNWIDGEVRGSAIAQAMVSLSGSGSVMYSPISCSLTEIFWPTGLCSAVDIAVTMPSEPDAPVVIEPVLDIAADDSPLVVEPVLDITVDDSPVIVDSDPVVLTTNAATTKGRHEIQLAWKGANGPQVDIFRDGILIRTVSNTGSWNDRTGNRGSQVYVHRVCEAGTTVCSAEVATSY